MHDGHRHFIPAAGRDFLLPLYDPFVWLLGVGKARAQLVAQAALQPGQRVLEIGCGTGSLCILIKQLHPQVDVVGLDPDAKALARAQRKAVRAGVEVRFEPGYADPLAFDTGAFDAVFSSLMLHHLEPEQQQAALREVRRVLRPGGALHLLDFAAAERPRGFIARLLHSDHEIGTKARVSDLLRGSGFGDVRETGERSTLVGPIAYHCATT